MDYVLVIPADQFSEAILEEEALDQTSVFISQCGNNHFDISTNTTGFCRDAVFSLTTQYYDGALKCECNYAGSLSFECEQFGGQCQCKENVIGRRCDLCKTGYYGFPNCRPCSCPATSLCQDETGNLKFLLFFFFKLMLNFICRRMYLPPESHWRQMRPVRKSNLRLRSYNRM